MQLCHKVVKNKQKNQEQNNNLYWVNNNRRICKKYEHIFITVTKRSLNIGDTGGPGAHGAPYFCKTQRKSFKAETIERLSPRSKCHYLRNSGTSRIQKFFLSANHGGWQCFSVFHDPSTLKSISTTLLTSVSNNEIKYVFSIPLTWGFWLNKFLEDFYSGFTVHEILLCESQTYQSKIMQCIFLYWQVRV